MSTPPPLRRFLGLEEDADDRALLGLEESAPAALVVLEALERRLTRVARHPAGSSEDGDLVRRRLREAAERLISGSGAVSAKPATPSRPVEPVPPSNLFKESGGSAAGSRPTPPTPEPPASTPPVRSSPTPPAPTPPARSGAPTSPARPSAPAGDRSFASDPPALASTPVEPGDAPVRPGSERQLAALTAFDRTALAILVGSGGWNATSRARLMDLASMHGVPPEALMRIVGGLSELLSSRRFGVVSGGQSPLLAASAAPARVPVERSRTVETIEQISEALAREFRSDSKATRTRLAFLFGSIALVVVVGVGILLALPSPELAREQRREELRERIEQRVRTDADPAPSIAELLAPRASGDERAGDVLQAKYPRRPGFAREASPDAARALLQSAPGWMTALDRLARKVGISANTDSASIRREWGALLDEAGGSWPLLADADRARIVAAQLRVVREADDPGLARGLVDMVTARWDADPDPLDVWRASWSAGLLGEIEAGAAIDATARDEAARFLNERLGWRRSLPAQRDDTPFARSAGDRLDDLVTVLIDRALLDEATLDAWELWFVAQRRIRRGVALQAAWIDALDQLLRLGSSLARAGAQSDLMGRLIEEIEWGADAPDRELLAANVGAWFADDDVSASSLWVLTSLLAQGLETAWFDGSFVVPSDASIDLRMELAEEIEDAWPRAALARSARGIEIDRATWARLRGIIDALPGVRGEEPAAVKLHRAAFIGAIDAATLALTLDRPDEAEEAFEIAAELGERGVATGGRTEAMEAISPPSTRDGAWTEEWRSAKRDPEERARSLTRLSRRRGEDLGPVDADTLAVEALKGSPRDVRLAAQDVVIDSFAYAPTVIVAILDRLDAAPRTRDTSVFVARLAQVDLPPVNDEDWPRASRLALVRMALELMRSDRHDIAIEAQSYERVLAARVTLLGGDPGLVAGELDAIATTLVDRQTARTRGLLSSAPFPAPVEEIDRRRTIRLTNADSAPQRLVAELLTMADLLAYEVTAGRTDLVGDARRILDDGRARRALMLDALEQVVDIERTLLDLHLLRLVPEGGGSA